MLWRRPVLLVQVQVQVHRRGDGECSKLAKVVVCKHARYMHLSTAAIQ